MHWLCLYLPVERTPPPPALPQCSWEACGTSAVFPPIFPCKTCSSLLVSPAMKPLGGSVSSQPLSQPLSAKVALSWGLKTWREAPSLPLYHSFSPRSQSGMTCTQCLTEPLPSLPAGSPSTGSDMSLWGLGREPKSERRFLCFPCPFPHPRTIPSYPFSTPKAVIKASSSRPFPSV